MHILHEPKDLRKFLHRGVLLLEAEEFLKVSELLNFIIDDWIDVRNYNRGFGEHFFEFSELHGVKSMLRLPGFFVGDVFDAIVEYIEVVCHDCRVVTIKVWEIDLIKTL